MIGTAEALSIPHAGRALVERLGTDRADLPVTDSAPEWVEALMSRLPAAAACLAIEHLFGVLPVVDAFFAARGPVAEVVAGRRLGALGLFTPTPALRWGATVEAEPHGDGAVLRGDVRLASPAAEGSIVLLQVPGGQQRLAWLDHEAPGVERRESRHGGACRLAIDGVAVGPELLSPPVGVGLWPHLERYASVWALAAAICARDGVRALRRAARTTAFNASQWVAMGITEVEIEAELTTAAVYRDLALAPDDPARAGGLALAAAAAGVLVAVSAKTRELRDLAGVEIEDSAGALTAYLGGPLLIESELSRALGIPLETSE